MPEENVLNIELEKLEMVELKKTASLWNLQKVSLKDKKSAIHSLQKGFQEEFFLKGVLEKFSPVQVVILTSILKNKNVMTLGEISRKVNLPPINVEMELGVLRKYFMVYQRKNRERLTNNLDKYHTYPEIASIIKVEENIKSDKFKFSLEKFFGKTVPKELPKPWQERLQKKLDAFNLTNVLSTDGLTKLIASLNDVQRDLIHRIYINGGVIEAETLRSHIIQVNKGKFEDIIPELLELYLVRDVYYVDEKFIRTFVLPMELIEHFQTNPILPSVKATTKQRQEKIATNELDFYLNTKKLLSYISRKGLNLAKSGKVKQADHKRTESELLNPDLGIFPEKSQIYQIELILPILKLLGYVDSKEDNVVLVGEWEEFIKKDIFEIMKTIVHEVNEARSRRMFPAEVFLPTEIPFYDKPILDKTVKLIQKFGKINTFVIFAQIIRDQLLFAPGFRIKTFEEDLTSLRKEIQSAVFYLHLFGLLEVEYPNRFLSLSPLGKNFFTGESLPRVQEKGGITINPDFSIIAFPDRMSLYGIHLLKAFCELKDYDRVYTFILTKSSYQLGLLLGYTNNDFLKFLRESNKSDLSQNLLFLLDDWGKNLPVLTITENSVLIQTKEASSMDLLLGQIRGKKFVLEEISPTAIVVEKSKVMEIIAISEKLNLFIKLIR